MENETFDFAIIGAGMTGLNLAAQFALESPKLKVQILEKSKSCGGRLATRRINDIKYDHGAQFVEDTMYSRKLIENWQRQGVAKEFPKKSIHGICAQNGITQLAKSIANQNQISYDYNVASLKFDQFGWKIISDCGTTTSAKNVILTSPLPQAIDILARSKIEYNLKLNDVLYTKAIVLLIEADQDFAPDLVYKEGSGETILTITAQHKKGNSITPAWTIVMGPSWSKDYFELSDDQILETAMDLVKVYIPELVVKNCSLKKWRYAFPMMKWQKTFECVQPGIYLVGDAFGGPSVNGALISSHDLFDDLKQSHPLLSQSTDFTLKN